MVTGDDRKQQAEDWGKAYTRAGTGGRGSLPDFRALRRARVHHVGQIIT